MDLDHKKAFDQLRFKKVRYVIYHVEGLNVKVHHLGDRKDNLSNLKAQLDDIQPAFIIYDYEFVTKDGRRSDKMFLVQYMPVNCNQASRISTSHALQRFKNDCPGTILQEVEDLDDFDVFMPEEEHDPSRL